MVILLLHKGVSRTLFHLKNLLGNRAALRLHRQLQDEEWLSAEELDALNWQRRQQMVRWAWDEVPFYRDTWSRAGFHPDMLKQPADWLRVPTLSKPELRSSFADLRAQSLPPSSGRVSTTGGSTGEPVKVLFDRKLRLEAFAWRVMSWWGVHPSDDIGFIFRLTRRGWRHRLNQLLWWPTRRAFLDASCMSRESILAYIGRLQRIKPAVLQGYVGAVHELATVLRTERLSIPGLKSVWVTSAPLPASQRAFMQEAFSAPVYDQYGAGEVYWIASECECREGLHVFHGHRHVEMLDGTGRPAAPGEDGEIHLTDLDNRVFPIIRYGNGDRGRWLGKPCSCGRSLPLMAPVKGRVSDMIIMPDGLKIAGDYLTTLFDSTPEAVKSFQIHQDRKGDITLRCVPGDHSEAREQIDAVCRSLASKAGAEIRLDLVSHIEHDRGKTRFIIREQDS